MDNITPLIVTPTLVVGIGGTGSLGVQYAKQKIRKQLKRYARGNLPAKVPFIEHLVLDTTSQEEIIEKLAGDESFNMGHINVPRLMRAIDRNPLFERALKWFPRHLNPGQIDSGARGVRHIGRLCFVEKKAQIEPRIRSKVQSITDYAVVDRFAKEYFHNLSVDPGSTVSVHLVSSMCGGTGSACLLDTAYLIKHVIDEMLKQGANSTAHLVTSEPFTADASIGLTSREYIQYNFALTLSEIERFMNFDVSTSRADARADHGWKVEYLDGSTVFSVEKPFSLTYLLGNKEGESLSKRHVCEIIGESIAVSTVYPESHSLNGYIDNIKAHVISQTDTMGKSRAFSSYNIGILNAEFDEEAIESSVFLATGTIIRALSSRNASSAGLDQIVTKIKAYSRSQQGDITVELSRSRFRDLYTDIDNYLDINTGRFAKVEARLRTKSSGGWFRRRAERAKHEKVNEAKSKYDNQKDDCKERSQQLLRQIEKGLNTVRTRIEEQVTVLLKEGTSLVDLGRALELLEQELREILADLNARLIALGTPEGTGGDWLETLVAKENFSNAAATRLRIEVVGPLLRSIEGRIRDVSGYVEKQISNCERAVVVLDRAKDLLKERRTKPYSFTERSIWTKELIEKKIVANTETFVSSFIKKLEEKAALESVNQQEKADFLKYLNPNEPDRSRDALQLVQSVARAVVKSDVEIFGEIDYNRNNDETEHEAIRNEELNRFVELASPTWQIERAGEDIAEVSITNCPRETELGRVIADMGETIIFSDNGSDNSQIIVFRSEHGVSADRLLTVRQCMDSVRRKLVAEEKSYINDLCLNPDWQIEDPTTTEKVESIRVLFSLGDLFDLVSNLPGYYYFVDDAGSKVHFAVSEGQAQTTPRSVAFAKFLRLRSRRTKSLESLVERIRAEWERRRNTNVVGFRGQVLNHIHKLEAQLVTAQSFSGGEAGEVNQYAKEIEALTNLVIPQLQKYIEMSGIESDEPRLDDSP